MKTYDPRKFTAVFAGVNLNRGFADGTWIKITPAAPRFSSKIKAARLAGAIRQVNLVGTVTV